MVGVLGWILVVVAVFVLISALKKPEAAASSADGGQGSGRGRIIGGIVALVLGAFMAAWPTIALARLAPVELRRPDSWCANPAMTADSPIHWDGDALVADLEAGSGRYGVFPVDWEANRFEAEWDLTITHLDRQQDPLQLTEGGAVRTHRRTRLDYASCAIGLMDQNVANIDDRDHVSGSAIQACFSDDIRLRASDANFLVRTASAAESGKKDLDLDFKPGTPIAVALNLKYHCKLTYDGRDHTATLEVTDDAGKPVVSRRLEDLKDFTSSVAWFGLSVRGYNRFDKKLDPKKGDTGYTRPRAVVRLENLAYRQP